MLVAVGLSRLAGESVDSCSVCACIYTDIRTRTHQRRSCLHLPVSPGTCVFTPTSILAPILSHQGSFYFSPFCIRNISSLPVRAWLPLPLCVLRRLVESDSATPWTVARQAPLSMGFPSKNTGVGCHFLLQEIFQTRGLNPRLFVSSALAGDSLPLSRLGIHRSYLACLWLTARPPLTH